MEYIVEYKVKGQSLDICVPSLFFVYVWKSLRVVEIKAEFIHKNKRQFTVVFGEKIVCWTESTLLKYNRMAIPDHLLPVPPMPKEKCLVM